MSDTELLRQDPGWEDDAGWKDIEAIIRATYIRTGCTRPEKLDILLGARPGICGIRQSAGLLHYPMVPSTGLFVFFSEEFIPGETLSPLCLLQTHRQRAGHMEEYYLSLCYTATAPMPSVAAAFTVRKWIDNEQYYLAGEQMWEPASPVTDPVDPKAPDYIWEEMCRGAGSKNLISVLRDSVGSGLTREILIRAVEQYAEPVEFLNRAGGCGSFLLLTDQKDSAVASAWTEEGEDCVLAIVPAQTDTADTVYLYEGPGRYRIAVRSDPISHDWGYADVFSKTGQMISLSEIQERLIQERAKDAEP